MNMQAINTALQPRQALRPSLPGLAEAAARCRQWLNAKSETFSALCGEDFTHREVLLAHAAFAALVAACCLAELIQKGGAL